MAGKVIVVGAGIVGVSTAIWLQRDGAEVTLIDRDGPAAGASQGNAGLLAASAMLPNSEPGLWWKAPLMALNPNEPLFWRWSYLPRMVPWIARFLSHCTQAERLRISAALAPLVVDTLTEHRALSDGTPAARYVHDSDYVYAYADQAAFERAASEWELRRAHGVTFEVMDRHDYAQWDPFFAGGPGLAVRMGGHGRISDPEAYVTALADVFVSQGGRLITSEVTDIAQESGQVTGVRAGGAFLPCDHLVVTAGVWSGPLARALGLKAMLTSERGYHLELWDPSAMPRAPTMLAAGKFVATPMDGRLRLAGIDELGGIKAGPSNAPFRFLERKLKETMPGVRWHKQTRWMGHRPSTPDSLPLIGAVPGVRGAWIGVGHQHVGLTGGPITGRWLSQMIHGRTQNVDMTPFAPGRFG